MRSGSLVLWFARHPMVVVMAGLLATASLTWALAVALRQDPGTSPQPATVPGPGIAVSTLPEPTEFPPDRRVAAAHRALHAVGRACKPDSGPIELSDVERPVKVIEDFARQYPNGGFRMDDERGTTLALLVVVRFELQGCAPPLAARIERLLPAQFRDPS